MHTHTTHSLDSGIPRPQGKTTPFIQKYSMYSYDGYTTKPATVARDQPQNTLFSSHHTGQLKPRDCSTKWKACPYKISRFLRIEGGILFIPSVLFCSLLGERVVFFPRSTDMMIFLCRPLSLDRRTRCLHTKRITSLSFFQHKCHQKITFFRDVLRALDNLSTPLRSIG